MRYKSSVHLTANKNTVMNLTFRRRRLETAALRNLSRCVLRLVRRYRSQSHSPAAAVWLPVRREHGFGCYGGPGGQPQIDLVATVFFLEGTAGHGSAGSSSFAATALRRDLEVPVEAVRCPALLGRCSPEGCAAAARVEFAAVHALVNSSLGTKPPNFIQVGSSRMALLMAREQTCEEASAICGWGSLLSDAFTTPSSGDSIATFAAGTSSLIRETGACSMNSSKDSGNSLVTQKDSFTGVVPAPIPQAPVTSSRNRLCVNDGP